MILDTNILVLAERQRKHFAALDFAGEGVELAISVLTVSELYEGVFLAQSPRRAEERRLSIGNMLRFVEVIPFTLEITEIHARLRATLRQRGALIGAHDLIIAATALHRGWPLKTGNTKEFERIEGLQLSPL